MPHITFTKALHSQELFGQIWIPESETKAVLTVVHGHGEHSGRYAAMAAVLNEASIALAGIDLFGHGKTTGKKGHISPYDAMMDAADLLITEVKNRLPGVPVMLYGHSMGGNIVAGYVLRRGAPVQGVILSAAFLVLEVKPTAFQLFLANLGKHLMPALAQPTKLDPNHISQIPEEVETYKNDPLIHDLMSATLYWGILNQADYILEHASKWNLPLLVVHGTGDRIIAHRGSKQLTDQINGDVTYTPYEGGYHELHHDVHREAVLEEIKTWILEHAVRE